MNDNTGNGLHVFMTTCKYRLPCGYCELKKELCMADNPMMTTPIWTDSYNNPSQITCSVERKEK